MSVLEQGEGDMADRVFVLCALHDDLQENGGGVHEQPHGLNAVHVFDVL